ncbi:CLUMA_CG015532, isoform A [Clunio marinus]|uniref:CLUMA_CG015532, isoform A n=1 Tax=Clunio marinus TaxID=568069 RepID=A0A1J1IPF6_9DIPT|nr:CLUMA_CG015532, isoform A [Clunio marinus]
MCVCVLSLLPIEKGKCRERFDPMRCNQILKATLRASHGISFHDAQFGRLHFEGSHSLKSSKRKLLEQVLQKCVI